MSLPQSQKIEIPILHELAAVGGSDDVRWLYARLISYFPSLSDAEINNIKTGTQKNWRAAVQKAGKALDEEKYLVRERGVWSLTDKGRRAAHDEISGIAPIAAEEETILSHVEVQKFLLVIGELLGFHAQMEYEYYDVVWREKPASSRLSHVYEVQSKGNLDSALAKLKRAYGAQRSKPFLIVASERDTNRARKSLINEFSDLADVMTILSFPEIKKIHDNLISVGEVLSKFLAD